MTVPAWPERGDRDYVEKTADVIAGIQTGDLPIALPGIAGALGEWVPDTGVVANMRVGTENVLDHGADPTGDDDSTASIIAAQAAGNPYFPDGDYRTTTWIPALSNRTWTFAQNATLINDRTDAQTQRQACILPGLMHPALFAVMTSYELDNITAGARAVTCSTAGEAANFAVGELVIVATEADDAGGVPRHGQLTKITGISGGVVSIRDAIAVAMTDGLLWKISGTDSSSGYPIYAVENFNVIGGTYEGRSALATKGCVYNGSFRDMTMDDVLIFMGTNMLTNTLIENLRGTYSGRYLEFANNSYNCVARNWDGQWVAPTVVGDASVLPIHLGEQPYRILLDNVRCHIPEAFAIETQLAQIKGSQIIVRDADWEMNGSYAGAVNTIIPDSSFAGYPHREILFDGGRLAAPGKARLLAVGTGTGGVADTNTIGVDVRGTVLDGTVTNEAIWFYSGSGHRCSARNRTGTAIKVAASCEFPDLTGYQGATLVGAA